MKMIIILVLTFFFKFFFIIILCSHIGPKLLEISLSATWLCHLPYFLLHLHCVLVIPPLSRKSTLSGLPSHPNLLSPLQLLPKLPRCNHFHFQVLSFSLYVWGFHVTLMIGHLPIVLSPSPAFLDSASWMLLLGHKMTWFWIQDLLLWNYKRDFFSLFYNLAESWNSLANFGRIVRFS